MFSRFDTIPACDGHPFSHPAIFRQQGRSMHMRRAVINVLAEAIMMDSVKHHNVKSHCPASCLLICDCLIVISDKQ